MTPAQVRMARAALDLSSERLAADARVPLEELKALESGGGNPQFSAKLRATFEGAGIEFLGEDGVKHHALPAAGQSTIPADSLNSANDE